MQVAHCRTPGTTAHINQRTITPVELCSAQSAQSDAAALTGFPRNAASFQLNGSEQLCSVVTELIAIICFSYRVQTFILKFQK